MHGVQEAALLGRGKGSEESCDGFVGALIKRNECPASLAGEAEEGLAAIGG
jgi:hypothetical protein